MFPSTSFPFAFDRRIDERDLGLFGCIEAQLTDPERISLLDVQRAVRNLFGSYCYLEIGSHLGGSIQPHLLDPRCLGIVSIDKRPLLIADGRGSSIEYPGNSSARMMENLQRVCADHVSKVKVFDLDASSVPRDSVGAPNLCFIDGEHTDRAAISDFLFCLDVVNDNGLIVFHDSSVVWRGLIALLCLLHYQGRQFEAFKLNGSLSLLALGGRSRRSLEGQLPNCKRLEPYLAYHASSAFARRHMPTVRMGRLLPGARILRRWAGI